MDAFKRQLCKFYSWFYLYLVACLLFLNVIISNKVLFFLVYLSTWIFQIHHSAMKGTKPPQSFRYFITVTISKLFFPVSNFNIDLFSWLSMEFCLDRA